MNFSNYLKFLLLIILSQTTQSMDYPKDSAQEPLFYNILDIKTYKDKIYQLPITRVELYNNEITDVYKKVHFYKQSKRNELPKEVQLDSVVGFSVKETHVLFLDGLTFELIKLDERQKYQSTYSIIYDRIRPPADNRGEPTRLEISSMRKDFLTKMKRPRKIKSWSEKDENSYLLLTSMPSYPILSLECDKKSTINCEITRACFINGYSKNDEYQGIAFGKNKNKTLLFLGNRSRKSVEVYDYRSCFHSQKIKSIKLPDKMETLNALMFHDGILYLSTTMRDFYNNSLYGLKIN